MDPSADPTTADVTVSGGKTTVSLPDFEKDIAVKLVAKSDDYTAIDISTDGKNNDSFVYGDSVWLYSMGAEIGGSGDAGRFVYRTIEGDFTLTARISRVGYLGSYSKAGLMVRQTQSPTSKMGFIGLNGRGEVSFISRNGDHGTSTHWKKDSWARMCASNGRATRSQGTIRRTAFPLKRPVPSRSAI